MSVVAVDRIREHAVACVLVRMRRVEGTLEEKRAAITAFTAHGEAVPIDD